MAQCQIACTSTIKKGFLFNVKKHWRLYLFLLLPLIYLLVFKYYPMLGLQIAFRKYTIRGGIWNSEWVGMKNFLKFFSSYQFSRILPNTIILSFYQLIAGFPIPVILALCFHVLRNRSYKKFVQTVTYIPYFISVVVLVGMVFQIFNVQIGLYGKLSMLLKGIRPNDLLSSPDAFRHLYVWSGIWQDTGWATIIYIAALSGVDTDLYEAAEIDGASRFKKLLHIDLPTILPTISIMLILQSGSIMDIGFEKVYLMQNNLNLSTSEVISTYVYKVGLAAGGGDFSYATAIDFFNSLVNFLIIVTVNQISKMVSDTSLW